MRSRLGGCAVALVLLVGACGVDTGSDGAAPDADAHPADLPTAELVSSRDTLPPAPGSAASLTVVLTSTEGADDPGLDAAAAALAQRPDLRVVVVVPSASGVQDGGATTMSGFPVTSRPGGSADAITTVLADPATQADLVVVGIGRGHGIGDDEPAAEAAVAQGVPALVVGVEDSDGVDYAAATMQLLEVLDLELDRLLGVPPATHRLAVPSCVDGILRGRVTASASPSPAPDLRSDCRAPGGTAPRDAPEAVAFATGWATLTRVP